MEINPCAIGESLPALLYQWGQPKGLICVLNVKVDLGAGMVQVHS